MAHHHRHGNMQTLTPIAVIPHQHHLILQIIELNLQNGSVMLRVRDRSGRVLYIYRESKPFDPVVTGDNNRGVRPNICFMTVMSCYTLPIFDDYISVNGQAFT